MEKNITVGMSDLKVGHHPCTITTLGLGSCVAITLYDIKTKVSGMAHIMLPYSYQSKTFSHLTIAKFADTGIEELLNQMLNLGAMRKNIVAKIAGGAQMFSFTCENEAMRIGERNVLATKEFLSKLEIPLLAEDTGGNHGRSIELSSEEGTLKIKTIGLGTKTI